MCVPLWNGEKIEGLLSVDLTSPSHAFNDDDLDLLTAVAHQAALGIERMRSSQEVENQRQVRRGDPRQFGSVRCAWQTDAGQYGDRAEDASQPLAF